MAHRVSNRPPMLERALITFNVQLTRPNRQRYNGRSSAERELGVLLVSQV